MIEKDIFVTFELINYAKNSAKITAKRGFTNFIADSIKQASNQPNLLAFFSRFCDSIDVEVKFLNKPLVADFLKVCNGENATALLNWIRNNYRVAASLIFISDDVLRHETFNSISLDDFYFFNNTGHVIKRRPFDVNINVICTSPLSHGDDKKSGNSKLFRRMDAKTNNDGFVRLPFYSGNAIRGQIRDLLADHFVKEIGLEPGNKRFGDSLKKWFAYAIYSGGSLTEKSADTKSILKTSGGSALNPGGISKIREQFPSLSVLGWSFGNRMLSGSCKFGDLRPVCYEWGYDTEITIYNLLEWQYLTRREDFEDHEDKKNSSMIANTECLKTGTQLQGGIDFDFFIDDLEKSVIGKGLELLKKSSWIGAENSRGFGSIEIEYENSPSPKQYESFLDEKKEKILNFMKEINAI